MANNNILCELSQEQLKNVAVGQERLSKMTNFEVREHEQKLNKVIEECKAREPQKFWTQNEIYRRAIEWRDSQYERRILAQLKKGDRSNANSRSEG